MQKSGNYKMRICPASNNLKVKPLIYHLLSWLLLPVSVFSILPYYRYNASFLIDFNNTTFWWTINVGILTALLLSRRYLYNSYIEKDFRFIKMYLIYTCLQFFHGVFVAEIYWDWKALFGNMLALLLSLAAYTTANPRLAHLLFQKYFKYIIFLFFPIAILIRNGAFGFFLAPVSLFILFLPLLTRKWKFTLLSFAVLVIFIDLGARSNVIKFGTPVLLLSIYYVRQFVRVKLLNVVHHVLFIAPIVLFILAILNIFNVFKMDEYIQGNYVEVKQNADGLVIEESLTRDTRTFLYTEVLTTAQKYNSWVFGRSPARGNETESFAEWAIEQTGRAERLTNEVAILNIFTWTGLVGVILYALIFYHASFLAINRSNNIYIKMLGIYVIFRWVYAWVEDVNNFSLNYLMIWVCLGMCYSKAFRTMNNLQMKYWVRGIFDSQYTKRLKSYTRYLHQKKKTRRAPVEMA